MPVAELAPFVKAQLMAAGLANTGDDSEFLQKVDIIRYRFSTLLDFPTRGRAYFSDHFEIQPEAMEKLNPPGVRELLHELIVPALFVGVRVEPSQADVIHPRRQPARDHRGDRPQAIAELTAGIWRRRLVPAGHAQDVIAAELRVHRGALEEAQL